MVITTIQVDSATRDRLAALKAESRDTYDGLLNKLLDLIPVGDEEGEFTEAFRSSLLTARLNIRDGVFLEHDAVKQRLGLE